MSTVLIDNGGANLASVQSAFSRLGVAAVVTRSADEIRRAERVVLPGVGAAGEGMRRLREYGLDVLIPELVQPVLGICLGMQLLFEYSEENATPCLGVFKGAVARLVPDPATRVPHMGWNRLDSLRTHPVLNRIGKNDWFYFVHEYAAGVNVAMLADTHHSGRICAVAAAGNFVAAQFHPERSGKAGAQFLENFLEWDGCN